jgi:hypothetical protein
VTAGCNVCGAGDTRYLIAYPTGGHADWCHAVTLALRAAAQPLPRPLPQREGCVVDDCDNAHHARGVCGRHYQRLRRAEAGFAPTKEDSVSTDTDAIRTILAGDLIAARAENEALRADLDDLRRTLIRERAARKAEADRARSGRRWVQP